MTPSGPRRTLLGVALDGAGLGPDSSDGMTRVTSGDDYLLVGGTEQLHGRLQQLAETLAQGCRDEGTTLGDAPRELLREIISDLVEDD